jgi:hypothetical protein
VGSLYSSSNSSSSSSCASSSSSTSSNSKDVTPSEVKATPPTPRDPHNSSLAVASAESKPVIIRAVLRVWQRVLESALGHDQKQRPDPRLLTLCQQNGIIIFQYFFVFFTHFRHSLNLLCAMVFHFGRTHQNRFKGNCLPHQRIVGGQPKL